MINSCKKLVTDINRKADLDNNIVTYSKLLGAEYCFYAAVKMCMNFYTVKEMASARAEEGISTDFEVCLAEVTDVIKKYIIKGTKIDKRAVEAISTIRDKVEYKMTHLTSFTDGFEIYEYILNRVEAKVKNDYEVVDIDKLIDDVFRYVFSENDTVVINSKLQLVLSQLPVRMTKNKFYDILTNTLTIYKGGEQSSVENFMDMLKSSVLIKKPENFETEYENLYSVYKALSEADYSNLDETMFDKLDSDFNEAAAFIEKEVSCYVLLQEIINDTYAMILTFNKTEIEECINYELFDTATGIIGDCIQAKALEELDEVMMSKFEKLEGVQENASECMMILETVLEDVKTSAADIIKKAKLASKFDNLSKAGRLLSTSLFMSVEDETVSNDVADNDYIMKKRDELVEDFKAIFEGGSRVINRSIMSKVLSSMPIFLNSQAEIRNYLTYVLENCKDDSELVACSRLLYSLVEE